MEVTDGDCVLMGNRAYSGTSSSVLKLDSEFPNNMSFSDHWIVFLKMLKAV